MYYHLYYSHCDGRLSRSEAKEDVEKAYHGRTTGTYYQDGYDWTDWFVWFDTDELADKYVAEYNELEELGRR